VYALWKQGFQGASVAELAAAMNLTLAECRKVCRLLTDERILREVDTEEERFILETSFRDLTIALRSHLESYHREHPYHFGILKEELKGMLPGRISEKLYALCLSLMATEGIIAVDKEKIRLTSHTVRLSDESQEIEKQILDRLVAAGLQPPSFRELLEQVRCREHMLRTLLEYLAEKGSVLKISEDLYFHPEVIERLKQSLISFLKQKGEIQTQEFKTLSDTTRKYTIPLLEYFDRSRITLRVEIEGSSGKKSTSNERARKPADLQGIRHSRSC